MAVTRINNNQIANATIIASQKVSPGTIVDSLFAANLNISSNITIIGNLQVQGTTSTVQSVNTLINDPIVIFNNGYSGTPAYDVGILVNRTYPSYYNAAWIWREANVGFAGVLTSELGSTTGSINNTTYANLTIGNTTIEGYSVNSVSPSSGAFTVHGGTGISANLNVGGTGTGFGQSFNSLITAISSNTGIVNITQLSSTRPGLMITDTNNNGALTLRTGAFGGQLSTYGGTNQDIYIQPNSGASLHLSAGNGAVIAENNINSTNPNVGAIVVTGSGGVGIGGNLNIGTAASFESAHITLQSSKQNDIAIGKNTLKSGLSTNVTIIGTMVGTTSVGTNATVYGAAAGPAAIPANATYLGKSAGNLATGSDSVYVGYNSGSLVTTGQYNVILGNYDGNVIASLSNQVVVADGAGAPRIRIDASGNVFVVSGVNSTTANTGAFVVQGGAGIGGNLNVGGALGIASGRLVLDATQTSMVIAANTATSRLGTGTTVIGQLINSTSPAAIGQNSTIVGYNAFNTGNVSATGMTIVGASAGAAGPGLNSTFYGLNAGTLTTGALNTLIGPNAGSALTTGSAVTVLGANTMTGMSTVNNYVMISDGSGNGRISADNQGVVTIYGSTNSTNPVNGGLIVQGGLGVGLDTFMGGNLTVSGNLVVLGITTTTNSNTVTIEDSTIALHFFANLTPLNFNDGKDIGVITNYYTNASQKAFFGWQNSTSNFVYIDRATESAGNVISGTYGNVQFGSLWLSNTTASGSQTTGALVVKGGIGAGALSYLNSLVVDNNLTASGSGATITFSPTGAGTVVVNPATQGTIDNVKIGATTPANGTFTNLVVSGSTTPAGYNATFSGLGFVNVSPTGTTVINPTATGNMDNMYIGNTTPRQGNFTSVSVVQDLKLNAFTSNSVIFVAQGNLSVDQSNETFNFRRTEGNTFSTVALSIGHTSQNNLLKQGTDTFNVRYQGDSFALNSEISANTISQSPGWTTSTSRGTSTAPLVTQDGDFNGVFGAYAWTGGTPSYQEISSWRYINQGTSGAASGIGGQAQLWTKQDNGSSTLALRVDANQTSTFYGQVVVANTTATTNSTTGALYVTGGMSAGGNIVVAQSARFNDTQNANRDFYVRGGNDATLIWANTLSSYNSVIVGNSAVAANLVVGAKLVVNSSDSMMPPIGRSDQRPGTPVVGMLRYNSVLQDIEYYTNNGWYNPQSGAGATVVSDDQFNGDGLTTTFVMTQGGTTNSTFVAINGVTQIPTLAYTVFSGNTSIVFTEAPSTGDLIDVRNISVPSSISAIAAPLGFVSVYARNDGLYVTSGQNVANVSVRFVSNTTGGVNYYSGNITVGASPTVIDSFPIQYVRNAVYQITVYNPTLPSASSYETSTVAVIHDGTNAYRTQYAKVYNNASLGSITTSVTSGNVYVFYSGVNSGNYVMVQANYYS